MKRRAANRGVLSVAFAMLLAIILLFTGLALDVSQMYNRKLELQQLADSIALAAAQSLNGTAAGINDASTQAVLIANSYRYAYAQRPVLWNSAALSFSASADTADGGWSDAAAAAAAPANIRYARVDTSWLDGIGEVDTPFSALMGKAYATADMAAHAVAGRSGIEVAPLAICAMSAVADASRSNGAGDAEWVQYGFRSGVTYNLLNLNPAAGAATPEFFYVAPQAGSTDASDAQVGPYLCSGSMQRDSITGTTVTVSRPGTFNLAGQLNTRFDDYTAASPCTARGTPPDTNVKPYAIPNWMALPTAPYAQPGPGGGSQKLDTVADRASAPLAAAYGVLWAYGPARRYAAGHAGIATSQWQYLYPVASGSAPAVNAKYSASPPYLSTAAGQTQAPVNPGRVRRRLLYVPLLACPVPAGASAQAQVLAVARFFLAAPASAAAVSAEFAGIVQESTLGGMVELYQ